MSPPVASTEPVVLPQIVEIAARDVEPPARPETRPSLFEQFAGVYIFFRERLFRDDTRRLIGALWPHSHPAAGTRLVELGCGPGFYSRRIATCFPQLSVCGIDRSQAQLSWARRKAAARQLRNCAFQRDNVLELSLGDASCDVVLAARLFTVVTAREKAVREMFRVLRPGGRCLVAEPRYAFWASLPLLAMWLLARITGVTADYREPRRATVLTSAEFDGLFSKQPWRQVRTWRDGRYQYALCEKG